MNITVCKSCSYIIKLYALFHTTQEENGVTNLTLFKQYWFKILLNAMNMTDITIKW